MLGSTNLFGQNNSSNNPFAPKPFGSTTPFGSQMGSSIFGGTSTGVFGAAQMPSPLGASSSPVFGSSMPAFRSSSTPAFGSSSTSFGGSSGVGQKPAFGGFGSTPTQTNPFGSATQPSHPAFGSSIFGSSTTPFDTSSQPVFGSTGAPAFGTTSTSAFGAMSSPAFGATIGATSTSAFGATSSPAFGATSSPAFGATSTPAFGSTLTPAFGSTFGSSTSAAAPSIFGSSTSAFGANSSTPAFGSSTSLFNTAAQVCGQNNSSNNPFAPKPFGITAPFASQMGSSIFGDTSTGVFGAAQMPSPFGASSSPVFSSSMPAFGSSSTPAFGSSSTSFGGVGQKPAFGGFGSTPTQTNPFGSATQPSQPAFGSSIFGSSTPFGASSQPTFGSTGAPSFGATSTPTFGATSTPAFGATSTPAFGATSTPAFGATSTPAFGTTSAPAFGATSAPAFGSTSTPAFGSTTSAFGMSNAPFGGGGAFGSSNNPMFGSTSTSAFGTSSSPFGASSSPAFGASSTHAFSFGSTQAFGQSSSAFGSSSPFGSTTPAFRDAFELQTTVLSFGNTGLKGFRGQLGDISVVSYPAITEEDGGTSGQTAKLESISAMPAYKYKRFESCVAIAGADYCVIAADYTHYHHTKISQLTEKSVIASSGLQADVKALQEVLSILIYKHQHNKPMSCPDIYCLLSKVLVCKYPYHPFTVLGGFDSEGRGCVFTHYGGATDYGRVGYNSQEELIIPPILEYKIPDDDVVARLSETEAVDLAKTIFASTTCTGDKLEIVVLNASGLRREYMDLRKKD